jgi:DNA polymerase-1
MTHLIWENNRASRQRAYGEGPKEDESSVSQLRSSECCAVDTESSGKDPHSAELFGISISGRQGEAFYVPFEHGPKWIEPATIALSLNKVLRRSIKVFGHNLKYDYVLLKRKGINIAHIDFDTMVAAYDCFGDSDVLAPAPSAETNS